jgi:excisionase family DNA binding protein
VRSLKLISVEAAAAHLSISPRSVRRYIAEGTLRGYRIAGRRLVRVNQDDVDALIAPIPAVSGKSA